jgi:hypothetical protein
MNISYWLMPRDASPFVEIVSELARRFDAPVFPPHLTIYSGPGEKDSPAKILDTVTPEFASIELRSTGVSWSEEFTQTLFVTLAPDEKLVSLSSAIRRAVVAPHDYELKPHLSLLYANLPPRLKRDIAATLSLPQIVLFNAIQAVNTGAKTRSREDVERWVRVAEARLGAMP